MNGHSIALDDGVLIIRHPHGNPESEFSLIVDNRLSQVGCRQLSCDMGQLRHDSRLHDSVLNKAASLAETATVNPIEQGC